MSRFYLGVPPFEKAIQKKNLKCLLKCCRAVRSHFFCSDKKNRNKKEFHCHHSRGRGSLAN